jgi:hypothetical protein
MPSPILLRLSSPPTALFLVHGPRPARRQGHAPCPRGVAYGAVRGCVRMLDSDHHPCAVGVSRPFAARTSQVFSMLTAGCLTPGPAVTVTRAVTGQEIKIRLFLEMNGQLRVQFTKGRHTLPPFCITCRFDFSRYIFSRKRKTNLYARVVFT